MLILVAFTSGLFDLYFVHYDFFCIRTLFMRTFCVRTFSVAPTSREINSQNSFSSGEKTCVGLLTISIENAGRLHRTQIFYWRAIHDRISIFIFVFSILQWWLFTITIAYFADGWIRTAELCCRRQLLYHVSHNHFPTKEVLHLFLLICTWYQLKIL